MKFSETRLGRFFSAEARRQWFDRMAKWSARATGRPITFLLAVLMIVVWLITGPMFNYSDTWQLVINTTTSVMTFLMVFLIQSTQNRDTAAVHVKLDELIRSIKGAHNALLALEDLTEEQLLSIQDRYKSLAKEAQKAVEAGGCDSDSPEVECPEEVAERAGKDVDAEVATAVAAKNGKKRKARAKG
jgi:low affinity Fe/Cu permease